MIKARAIAALTMLAMFATAPLLITPLGAQQLTDRAKHIGGKFMCMCGCSQVLTECNHVGCSTSASMLKELNQSLSRGNSERNRVSAWLPGCCRAYIFSWAPE